jgi:hypothetical protein
VIKVSMFQIIDERQIEGVSGKTKKNEKNMLARA